MTLVPLPSLAVQIKLASIVVHADEATSPDAKEVDVLAIRAGLADPEVQDYLKTLSDKGLLPIKRTATT